MNGLEWSTFMDCRPWESVRCPNCSGKKRDPKNRKRKCPRCDGLGGIRGYLDRPENPHKEIKCGNPDCKPSHMDIQGILMVPYLADDIVYEQVVCLACHQEGDLYRYKSRA